jgi:hypothetical protein
VSALATPLAQIINQLGRPRTALILAGLASLHPSTPVRRGVALHRDARRAEGARRRNREHPLVVQSVAWRLPGTTAVQVSVTVSDHNPNR